MKPKRKGFNLLLCAILLIVGILLGNLCGKALGFGKKSGREVRKEREYKYFGLEKLWAKEEHA